MKIVFVLLLIFYHTTLAAQSLQELKKQAFDLFEKGKYREAIPLTEKALTLAKTKFGENHDEYGLLIANLASLYNSIGNYEKSEVLYLKALSIQKITLGVNNDEYAMSLHHMGLLYTSTGNYKKAESFLMEALQIQKEILGESHADFGRTYNSLGSLFMQLGKYDKAEFAYTKAMEIRKTALGEMNSSYATSLNNLGSLYHHLGQYKKAEAFYIRALEIRQNISNVNHPSNAITCNNIGTLYKLMEDYEKAELWFEKGLEINKNIYGEEHTSIASGLNKLGNLYNSIGKHDKAESHLLRSLQLTKKLLGESHSQYAYVLNLLAGVYRSKKDYEKAESLYVKAAALIKQTLGADHPDYAAIIKNLSILYILKGQPEKAEPLLLLNNKIIIKNLTSNFAVLSDHEKNIYLDDIFYNFDQSNSFLYKYKNNPVFIKEMLNDQIAVRSVILSNYRSLLNSLQNSRDTTLIKLLEKWKNDKRLLAQQYSLPIIERLPNLDKVKESADVLEKELNRMVADLKQQKNDLQISVADIQNRLQDDEVAIEFVHFKLYNNRWTDSVMYAAYIIDKNSSTPVFVPLFEEKQLQQLFADAKNTTVLVNSFYRGVGDENENISVSKGDSLYKLIWLPLEPYLKGIKKISYSPTGKLYTIAFNALPVSDGKILMDKYELQQYTSTKQVALRISENEKSLPKSIALFGDATFTLDSLQLIKGLHADPKNTIVSTNIYTPLSRGTNNTVWSNLPGTAIEVNKIQNLFSQNKIAAKIFVQQQASEEKFKSLSGNSPQVLHLATHGFFLPEADKKRKDLNDGNVYSLAEDPLMRSGILLSGANYAWSGKTPINGLEDGIATAYEISQLDLSKTELVVLSACETALGDIKGSEGVFGLQRAFKMAGVNKLIVSLWQVPDKETAELMSLFYKTWLAGNSIKNSFTEAQREIRKKYSPFYWAAFVLVE